MIDELYSRNRQFRQQLSCALNLGCEKPDARGSVAEDGAADAVLNETFSQIGHPLRFREHR